MIWFKNTFYNMDFILSSKNDITNETAGEFLIRYIHTPAFMRSVADRAMARDLIEAITAFLGHNMLYTVLWGLWAVFVMIINHWLVQKIIKIGGLVALLMTMVILLR